LTILNKIAEQIAMGNNDLAMKLIGVLFGPISEFSGVRGYSFHVWFQDAI
jgi:hypothetical protein